MHSFVQDNAISPAAVGTHIYICLTLNTKYVAILASCVTGAAGASARHGGQPVSVYPGSPLRPRDPPTGPPGQGPLLPARYAPIGPPTPLPLCALGQSHITPDEQLCMRQP